MIGGVLFRRFLLRFLIGLGLAILLFLPLVHVFQYRTVNGELRDDLRQEATWLALHFRGDDVGQLASAWRTMHNSTRVTFFDAEGELLADSHPERDVPDLAALVAGDHPNGYVAALEDFANGRTMVMSRPWIPAFPYGLSWELALAGVLAVLPMILLLYPLARSMSTTLRQLGDMAKDVAAGHFGRTLAVERSDELGALVQSFNDMSRKLEQAERLSMRLLNDVSHELRSPLSRIQVLAETSVLRPGEARECIRGIEQEIGLLDRLVGDLLQAARVESDARAPRRETFSVLHWARETLQRLESQARAHAIEWATDLPAEDREVRGDPQRLAQALGNLVDNAIHALDGRAEPRIDVSLSIARDAWSVTVADNGPGIPADDLPHVFRRFYRVDDHRDRDRGGVGLGLSLVRAIVEAHGGDASIESRVGEGSRITLSMPVG